MDGVTIAFSTIHGIGLFAKRHFREGETIIKAFGAVLNKAKYGWVFNFNPGGPNFGMDWIQISPYSVCSY